MTIMKPLPSLAAAVAATLLALPATDALAQACTLCEVDKTPRKWDQPSDHAPVVAQLS